MRLASVGVLAALSLAACQLPLKDAVRDQPPANDQVVLVGEVDFDPAIQPPGPPPGVHDTGDMFSKYMILFGDTPAPGGTWDEPTNYDRYATVKPGQPFAILAPRHTTYVKMLRTYANYEDSGNMFTGRKLTMIIAACVKVLKVPIHEDDQYVYVGHLICKHGDDSKADGEIVVDPGGDEITSAAPGLIGDHPLQRRLPTPVAPPAKATASTYSE